MPFDQNYEGHTFKDFRAMADIVEKEDRNLNWNNDKEIFNKIETQYWNYVENQVGDQMTIEYAADLNANQYGNGFGTKNMPYLKKE